MLMAPGGGGDVLQQHLEERRRRTDNWAYQWWLEDMYLHSRLPLCIHSNPGMVWTPRSLHSLMDVATFTSRIILGVCAHKDVLNRKALPIERATSRECGQPLCMAQFYRLLSCHREPGVVTDKLVVRPNGRGEGEGEHVVIMCANQMYAIPLGAASAPISEADLSTQLLHILQTVTPSTGPDLPRVPAIGLLTSERRDVWARAREHLMTDAQNRLNLQLVERALLVVCLDQPLPGGASGGRRDSTVMAHQMLHGGGTVANSGNRWFDKTIQVIVSTDGVCGLCYEHSPAEGVAVVQLVEALLKQCNSDLPPEQQPRTTTNIASTPPHHLEWLVDDVTRQNIELAAQNIDRLIADLDFLVYRYTGYGKEFIKSCKISPDVYIQLALQLAYYRVYGYLVATYESASTRRYRLGRVDCIRSATFEVLEWVRTMVPPQGDDGAEGEEREMPASRRVTFSLFDEKKKLELFDLAVSKQTDIMVQNILGQGIDIHLLGLRCAATELAVKLPELFEDEVYRIANHFILSTSQVATISDSFMGYGPVVPDGYGASYNPHSDNIVFCLSAFHSCTSTSTNWLVRAIEDSLNDMQHMLVRRTTTQSASAPPAVAPAAATSLLA